MPRKKSETAAKNRKSTKSDLRKTTKLQKSSKSVKTVKARVVDPDKPSADMSRRMLDSYVRRHGKALNQKLDIYRKNMSEWANVDERYKTIIKKVQEAGTGKNIGKPKIGYGYREKKKEELLLLARRIQEAERFTLEESDEEQQKRFENSYKQFVKHHVPADIRNDVTIEQYREMVDVFGSSGSLITDFGYEDYIQLVSDKIVKGYTAKDVIRTARQIMDEIQDPDHPLLNEDGTAMSTEDALDELRKRLGG